MFQEIIDQEDVDVDVDTDVDTDTDTDGEEDQYENLTQEEAVERLKKAEKAIVKHKKAPAKEATADSKAETINKPIDSTRLDRIELVQDGYPKEIVDNIMELGGTKALKNPIIKKSVDDMVTQYNAEKASNVQGNANSSINTKYSKEDLKNMSVEELDKILPKAN